MWRFIKNCFSRRAELPKVAPHEVLAKDLLKTRFDPSATRYAELFSGGFLYSDEMPTTHWPGEGYAFRFLLAYRGSLVRGEPDERLRTIWENTLRLCPQWPGFRSERCSTALRDELEAELRSNCRASLHALRDVDKRHRMTE